MKGHIECCKLSNFWEAKKLPYSGWICNGRPKPTIWQPHIRQGVDVESEMMAVRGRGKERAAIQQKMGTWLTKSYGTPSVGVRSFATTQWKFAQLAALKSKRILNWTPCMIVLLHSRHLCWQIFFSFCLYDLENLIPEPSPNSPLDASLEIPLSLRSAGL